MKTIVALLLPRPLDGTAARVAAPHAVQSVHGMAMAMVAAQTHGMRAVAMHGLDLIAASVYVMKAGAGLRQSEGIDVGRILGTATVEAAPRYVAGTVRPGERPLVATAGCGAASGTSVGARTAGSAAHRFGA